MCAKRYGLRIIGNALVELAGIEIIQRAASKGACRVWREVYCFIGILHGFIEALQVAQGVAANAIGVRHVGLRKFAALDRLRRLVDKLLPELAEPLAGARRCRFFRRLDR